MRLSHEQRPQYSLSSQYKGLFMLSAFYLIDQSNGYPLPESEAFCHVADTIAAGAYR